MKVCNRQRRGKLLRDKSLYRVTLDGVEFFLERINDDTFIVNTPFKDRQKSARLQLAMFEMAKRQYDYKWVFIGGETNLKPVKYQLPGGYVKPIFKPENKPYFETRTEALAALSVEILANSEEATQFRMENLR